MSATATGLLICAEEANFGAGALRGIRVDGLQCRHCGRRLSADSFSLDRMRELLRLHGGGRPPEVVPVCQRCAARYADVRMELTEDFRGGGHRRHLGKTMREIISEEAAT